MHLLYLLCPCNKYTHFRPTKIVRILWKILFDFQSDSSRSVTPCSDSQEGGSDTSTGDEGMEEHTLKVNI